MLPYEPDLLTQRPPPANTVVKSLTEYNYNNRLISRNCRFIIVSRSQRVSLIVIPFCLSVCRSFFDLQPTTIDRSQPNLVGRYIPVLGPV